MLIIKKKKCFLLIISIITNYVVLKCGRCNSWLESATKKTFLTDFAGRLFAGVKLAENTRDTEEVEENASTSKEENNH